MLAISQSKWGKLGYGGWQCNTRYPTILPIFKQNLCQIKLGVVQKIAMPPEFGTQKEEMTREGKSRG
jgi:hypothetical protein